TVQRDRSGTRAGDGPTWIEPAAPVSEDAGAEPADDPSPLSPWTLPMVGAFGEPSVTPVAEAADEEPTTSATAPAPGASGNRLARHGTLPGVAVTHERAAPRGLAARTRPDAEPAVTATAPDPSPAMTASHESLASSSTSVPRSVPFQPWV